MPARTREGKTEPERGEREQRECPHKGNAQKREKRRESPQGKRETGMPAGENSENEETTTPTGEGQTTHEAGSDGKSGAKKGEEEPPSGRRQGLTSGANLPR